jgi:hypothetical protein
MSGSERNKRNVVEGAKFKPIMRLRQHKDAQRIITKCFCGGKSQQAEFEAEIDRLSRKICDSDHEAKERDINVGYLRRILSLYDQIKLPRHELEACGKLPPIVAKGTTVKFAPQMVVRGVGRGNVPIIGALSLRYAKGKALPENEAKFEAAFALGYLRSSPIDDVAEPRDKLCLVFDGHTGTFTCAPGDSATRFANMTAACESIANMWDKIQPPKGAVLKRS